MRTPRIDLRDHCAQRRPTVVTAIAPLASDVPPGRLSQVSAATPGWETSRPGNHVLPSA